MATTTTTVLTDCSSVICHQVRDHVTGNTDWLKIAEGFSIPVNIILIVIVAWLASRLWRRFVGHSIAGLQQDLVQRRLAFIRSRTPSVLQPTTEVTSLRRAQRAQTIGALLKSTGTLMASIIAVLAILRLLDINLAPVLAGAGIATAALGFGAQNIVRDFLAGFFIVVEDQYGVGDVIDVGGASGLVESVSLRITRLRDVDGTLWHVPNGEIKSVANKSQQWSRAIIEFRLDMGTDIVRAKEIIQEVADATYRDSDFSQVILEEPAIWGPDDIGAAGWLLKLAIKTKPLQQFDVSRALRTQIKAALDENGITFAPLAAPAVNTPAQKFPGKP